jgi:hypothetical protein
MASQNGSGQPCERMRASIVDSNVCSFGLFAPSSWASRFTAGAFGFALHAVRRRSRDVAPCALRRCLQRPSGMRARIPEPRLHAQMLTVICVSSPLCIRRRLTITAYVCLGAEYCVALEHYPKPLADPGQTPRAFLHGAITSRPGARPTPYGN